jgi:glycosyltransferase involved in cell wall biosynthesis
VRVGLVVYGPLDRRSGGYLYDREVVDRLEAAGDDVTVVSLPERPYPARFLDNLDPRVGRRLETVAAEVDVLVVDELCHPSLAWALDRRDLAAPVVALVHHLASAERRPRWRNRAIGAVEARFLRAADAYVCASRATCRAVAAALDPDRATVPQPEDPAGRGARTEQSADGGRSLASDALDLHPDWTAGSVDGDGTGTDEGDGTTVPGSVPPTAADGDAAVGARSPPAIVAYPGADRFGDPVAPERVRERATEGPLRVLFVGAVTPRKQVLTLVEGLSRATVDWELTLVGDLSVAPEYVRRVRDRIDELSAADRVEVAGRLDDEALRAAFERHHLLAVPSAYEGFGIVYVEGMGFGLPAVASAAGGAPEVVRDRVNGRLVPPEDASAITDVVSPLARDRDRLARMGLAALETYHEHPTWAATADRVRGFLRSIAGEPSDADPADEPGDPR